VQTTEAMQPNGPRASQLPLARASRFASFLADERGLVLTEYVAVTGFFAVATLVALLGTGWVVAASFQQTRDYVLYPFP